MTFAVLWASTLRWPTPPGTSAAGYGLVAVLTAAATVLVPLSLVVGPIRILAASLLVLGVRQRDPRQVVAAVTLALLPLEVVLTEVWSAVGAEQILGQAAAALAFLLAGAWSMRIPRHDRGGRPAELAAGRAFRG